MNAPIVDAAVTGALRALYQNDQIAKDFLDWAAERTNDAAETSVDRIEGVLAISRTDAIDLARSLADCGCAEYIIGRKGWKTRLKWRFSLISVGTAARGEKAVLEAVDPELKEDVLDQTPAATESSNSQSLTIAEAKKRLAESLGVSPTAIEIVVRG